ncbi:hypothetical protein [Ligilactobacillus aviarius]|uniref:hypothetical protein n=1 Tax=Ligilactobacillus aviarius TaxID=1606 RepID=UPI0024BAEC47|nr:hypothetical protein [Ligilactobacillus aviarius]
MDSIIANYSIKIKKFKEKHPTFASALYLVALALFIIASMIKNSQMISIISQKEIFILEVIATFMVTCKIILLDDYNWKELTIFFLLEFYLYMSAYIAANVDIFYFSFFIIGARNVKAEYILKLFIWVNIIFMVLAAILALTGVIWNFSNTRGIYSPIYRYALGMAYPTDYAARGFALLLAYAVLKKFSLRLPEYISFIAVIFWFYLITRTRIDLLLSLLLIVLLVAYPQIKQLFKKTSIKTVNIIMLAYMFLIYLIGFLYTCFPSNKILSMINGALSGRLTHEQTLFQHIPINFTGRYIYQPGGGGGFFIDASFFRILWMYGIPMLLIAIVLFFMLNNRFLKNLNYLPIELAFIIFFISAGIDQHFLDASFNFVPLLLFANLEMFNRKQN